METIILYPVKAPHTRPMMCGCARAMARNNAHRDMVVLTPAQVISEAERAFKGFCSGQEVNGLTDDIRTLQAMYMSAYITEYHREHKNMMYSLKRLVKKSVIDLVLRMIRIA